MREMYAKKYEATRQPVKFDVSKAPRVGSDDARIRLVEFFDYECPHCAAFKPGMEQVLSDKGGQVAAYFLMFPIESKHPDSRSAAQAAIAVAEFRPKIPQHLLPNANDKPGPYLSEDLLKVGVRARTGRARQPVRLPRRTKEQLSHCGMVLKSSGSTKHASDNPYMILVM